MSKPTKLTHNIEQQIMSQIKQQQLQMRPRWYFVLGSLAMMLGLVSSFVTAVFVINLNFFLLRQHGPMGQWRLEQMLTSFPLWLPLLAAATIFTGFSLLKKYDFSNQHNFKLIAIAVMIAALAAGAAIDQLGLNDIWLKRDPMRGIYQHLRIDEREMQIKQGRLRRLHLENNLRSLQN
jgi:hypothetical protein